MHGTSPDGALGITDGGFRLDLTGSHAGTMFGSLVCKEGNASYFRKRGGPRKKHRHEIDSCTPLKINMEP